MQFCCPEANKSHVGEVCMPKSLLFLIVCLLAVCAPAAFAGVIVTSPANGATVSGSVTYAASATSSCSQGVASMGIYTAPGVLAYVVNGATLNKTLTLNAGTYNTTVEEWDKCGGAATTPIKITVSTSGKTGVYVTAPANNSSVGSPVTFSATASTTCSKGVSSMGIYTAPGVLAYLVNGASLNHSLALGAGTYNTVVQEWDGCGGASTTPLTITVSGGGKSFTNLQSSGGWSGYGQRAPDFVDCSPSPCRNITFSMTKGVKSPTMSGSSSAYYLAGTVAYGDSLWNNHLIGDLSSQGLPDTNHTLVPQYHNFTYDVYFWLGNPGLSQAMEFDLNQFFNSMGFIWGHECRIAGGNEWDVWDNVNSHWVATGIPCYPNANSWNHLVLQVQRTSDNKLLYQSITLNGVTHTLNQYYNHGSAPSSWWGVTINFQMDGDSKQSPYTAYLDKLNFTYQ
jgi:hypothetical protein